jgi:hypothetical protein
VKLERWIDPAASGFWSGDHHIHGAGCAHYTSPTEGVTPEDMFRQVRGEALNVGCVLTWGPCFDYQRRFFSPGVHELSEPRSILKYDIEVSGFGSEALGHVCLLNLKDQAYPGSEGTKTRGWPRWTTPVLRWAKSQGAYGGYAHSASGLEVNSKSAARRLLDELDADGDSLLTGPEAARGLLPDGFEAIDADRDGALSGTELIGAIDRAADRLPESCKRNAQDDADEAGPRGPHVQARLAEVCPDRKVLDVAHHIIAGIAIGRNTFVNGFFRLGNL